MIPEIAGLSQGPALWQQTRRELVALFEENVYGRRPDLPYVVESTLAGVSDACGGRGQREMYRVTIRTERGSAELELALVLPKGSISVPCVLMISNHDRIELPRGEMDFEPMRRVMEQAPEQWRQETMAMLSQMGSQTSASPNLLDIAREDTQGYWPVETILASGRAAAAFYASQAQPDDPSRFPEAVSALFTDGSRPRQADEWGTLGVWAFAASAMLTVLEKHPRIDRGKLSVAGHSRGGKTALWCAAQDERVNGVLVNNSGCSGAAVSRGKKGEVVASISAMFPHWFCENYSQYAWKEERMPFDQHMLVAAVAPRLCYVTSGSQDSWSDPEAEWLGAKEASAAWEMFGEPALPAQPPMPGEACRQSAIGYHRRAGGHDLTTWDWEQFLRFLDEHNG